MSKIDTNVLKDGQLAVATAPQNGTIISDASAVDATALVQTDNGPQLCVKTVEVGEGGGGGGGTVDQTYNPTSTNAQSGTAVAEAVAPALKNTATGDNSITIDGDASSGIRSVSIGKKSSISSYSNCVAIGYSSKSAGQDSTAVGCYSNTKSHSRGVVIGYNASIDYDNYGGSYSGAIAIGAMVDASAQSAIQLGNLTPNSRVSNTTPNSFQVFTFQMLDGTTGLIPAARIGTGYDATKTQVLKNVNGTLTWVDE